VAVLVLPDDADPAVVETHVSVIVFLGDRAYKLKKPIRTPFLDFSTAEARRRACLREVELNRRLSPDVYLGVADVAAPDGTPCDHLVVMRRLPAARRLSAMVQAGADVTPCLRSVAATVSAFHERARTSVEIASQGTQSALRGRWEANLAETAPFAGSVLDPAQHRRVGDLALRYIEGRGPLFEQRIRERKVRDVHGDLLADDVYCLDDGPRILDCIEFDDTLRSIDVVDDAAFLAMDLERLGGPDLGRAFLVMYREHSGDRCPATLAHHYVAYRAHVRAKVACLRHQQGDEDSGPEAHRLLGQALRHLEAGRVLLVLVGGLPGVGKSTLAQGLAAAFGWTVLRSDEVRRGVAHVGTSAAAFAYREGIYSPEATEKTYRVLLEQARALLEAGEPVVLDASWTDARRRREAAALADATSSDLVELRCETSPERAAGRLQRRAARGGDPSNAGPEIHRAMAADQDPWPTAVPIDTSGNPEETLGRARTTLQELLAEGHPRGASPTAGTPKE
jgi:hypothetical protein